MVRRNGLMQVVYARMHHHYERSHRYRTESMRAMQATPCFLLWAGACISRIDTVPWRPCS
eukprot:m.309507 g.309507  ORF g.309507 m.309507 type:complete len:60 (+) comp19640_c2_seq3:101-280(+)